MSSARTAGAPKKKKRIRNSNAERQMQKSDRANEKKQQRQKTKLIKKYETNLLLLCNEWRATAVVVVAAHNN